MNVKCYSVRLEHCVEISPKALKIVSFDGSEAIIPKSAYFGIDYEVQKSDAHWIAEFALRKKGIQYSTKKVQWFERDYKAPNEQPTQDQSPAEQVNKDQQEHNVKGYYLQWREVRVPINRFGKLALRNRQHIMLYNGPSSKAPKGFVELTDEEYEVARTKDGQMIEPYTIPSFTKKN